VLTIVDDEVGGTIQFSAATYTVGEGAGSAAIVLTRTGSTAGGATVHYATSDGTGVAGTDYTAASGTVTFTAGATSLTFTVPILANATPRGVRTVNLTLSNPGPNPVPPPTTKLGTRTSAVLRVVDNDVSLAFSAPTYSVKENAGLATIAVELSGVNVTPVTVAWATSDGTATAGSDYGTPATLANPTPPPPSGTLTFPPGGTPTTVRTKTFTVRILQDRVIEPTETVNLTLSAPTGGALLVPGRDTAVLSITDDDIGGVMQFSAATYTVGEGAGNASIVISRTGSTAGGATVDFATSDGTATAGTDYTTTTGTATFAVGQTALTFLVPVVDTAAADGVRTVNLKLSNPGPNATTTLGARSTAVLRIIDNQVSLGFSAPNYTVRENAGLATITVELTGVNATPVTVSWAASNGTATAGADYGIRGAGTPPGPTPPPTGVLTFPAGGTPTTVRTRTFTVPILNDTSFEGTETVNLTLSSPSPGAQLVTGRDTAVLSIVAGVIQFSASSFGATECIALPCNATLTVSRTGGLASGVTVDFTTVDGTAMAGVDYTATTSTVTFAASQATQTIKIPLLIEVGAQPTKSFSVVLSNPGSGWTLGARTTATVNITDTR
jgi:Calx-beta domain